MPSWLDRIKAMLIVMVLSFQPIVLAFLCMDVVWFISACLGHLLRAASTFLSGVVGFALGSIAFWQILVRFLERRGSKRS